MPEKRNWRKIAAIQHICSRCACVIEVGQEYAQLALPFRQWFRRRPFCLACAKIVFKERKDGVDTSKYHPRA